MSGVLWLKFICPVVVLCIVWIWNRERRKRKEEEPKEEKVIVPHLEFCRLGEIRERVEGVVGKEITDSLTDNTKSFQVVIEEEIIAIILFSWPSSLWHFREDRGEETSLGAYSHIHYIWVKEGHRKKGYFYKLMDMVISDTHRISSGLTIDLEDPELKELFRRKFEFTEKDSYMILSYDSWS